jgi:hypothetical protein
MFSLIIHSNSIFVNSQTALETLNMEFGDGIYEVYISDLFKTEPASTDFFPVFDHQKRF